MRHGPHGAWSQLAARRRNRVHRCPWGDGDTQRLGRFRWLFQPGPRSRGTVQGVGTQGAELQIAEQAPSTHGSRSASCVRARWSRAGRRATRGVHRDRRDRSGRRSNRHAPFDSSLAARTAGVERETPKHALVMHERATLVFEGPRRVGPRRTCSRAPVLETR